VFFNAPFSFKLFLNMPGRARRPVPYVAPRSGSNSRSSPLTNPPEISPVIKANHTFAYYAVVPAGSTVKVSRQPLLSLAVGASTQASTTTASLVPLFESVKLNKVSVWIQPVPTATQPLSVNLNWLSTIGRTVTQSRTILSANTSLLVGIPPRDSRSRMESSAQGAALDLSEELFNISTDSYGAADNVSVSMVIHVHVTGIVANRMRAVVAATQPASTVNAGIYYLPLDAFATTASAATLLANPINYPDLFNGGTGGSPTAYVYSSIPK